MAVVSVSMDVWKDARAKNGMVLFLYRLGFGDPFWLLMHYKEGVPEFHHSCVEVGWR